MECSGGQQRYHLSLREDIIINFHQLSTIEYVDCISSLYLYCCFFFVTKLILVLIQLLLTLPICRFIVDLLTNLLYCGSE